MGTHGRVTIRGANILFFIGMIMQLFIGIMVGITIIIIGFIYKKGGLSEDVITYILMVSTQIFAILIPVISYLTYKKVNIRETLRLKPLRPLHVVLSITIGISGQFIAQMLNLPVLMLLNLFGEIPPSPIPIPRDIKGFIISIIILAVFPAICEEVMARGIMLRAYEIRGTNVGIMVSALMFGLMHGDLKNLIGPVFFGIIFGYVVVRTDSILTGMIAHFMNNALAIGLEYFFKKYEKNIAFLDSFGFFMICFIISLTILIISIKLLNRTTTWQKEPSNFTVKEHLQAVFFSLPVIMTIVIYTILQVLMIIGIARGTA